MENFLPMENEKIGTEELNLIDFGNTIELVGAVYKQGDEKRYHCLIFPDEASHETGYVGYEHLSLEAISLEDWKKLIRQTDLVETEVLAKDNTGGILKILIRKTTRQIDTKVSWKVFQRDNYSCRYCGRTGIPLTVDHLVLWEEGGFSSPENLVASCKKCNRTRGNMQYGDWLKDEYYKRVSKELPPEIKEKNEAILFTLEKLPRRLHKISR